ncbi:MAG: M6 family metalloprotease domain-containing protein [Eubacteriales bacterium]|nr:M6 family metalloprotease domain-containing protein [Eubacteriales bacterium]
MNRAKTGLILLLTILLILCASSALAGTACPGIIPFTEPATGEIVQIYNRGDEYFSYMTDTDGNLLVLDENDYLRYVTEEDGVYALGGSVTQAKVRTISTNVNVHNHSDSLQSKLQALRNEVAASRPSTYALTPDPIPLDYNFVGDRAEGLAQVCTTEEDKYLDEPSNYPPMDSTCPLLVLKLQFNDVKCIFSDQQWHDRIFENGVTQYYQTVSNGKFTYVPVAETGGTLNDGVVTVTLPFACPRYALADPTNQLVQNDPISGLYRGTDHKNYAIYNMGSLYAYAMLEAESSVNFASFDRNNDGFISPTELAVLVVYSGFEASYGGAYAAEGKPAVWAHSWKYNNMLSNGDSADYHYMTMRVGGKRVTKYTVIGELSNYTSEYDYDTKSGTPQQAQYGTAAHELGHDMGLPDLYATRDANPSQRVEGLSLMGTGSWGAKPGEQLCSSPTHLDPVSKIYLGFYNAVSTDTTGNFTLYATEPSSNYNILRVNTSDPNVYYLIENRQYTGFDAGLALFYGSSGGGLVVWRVDQNALQSGWWPNTVNNVEDHYGLMPIFLKKVTNPDVEVFEPFWSVNSIPNATVLQSSPQLTFSALSLPNSSMNLLVERTLSFAGTPSYNIPSQLVDVPMTELDVSGGVYGGYTPYTFSLSDAPDWLNISAAGMLFGTPLAPSTATSAVVTATDSLGNTASISITVGEVKPSIIPPQTGDTRQPLLYTVLIAVSLVGLLLLWRRRRVMRL